MLKYEKVMTPIRMFFIVKMSIKFNINKTIYSFPLGFLWTKSVIIKCHKFLQKTTEQYY